MLEITGDSIPFELFAEEWDPQLDDLFAGWSEGYLESGVQSRESRVEEDEYRPR